jgi:hypothetical protein
VRRCVKVVGGIAVSDGTPLTVPKLTAVFADMLGDEYEPGERIRPAPDLLLERSTYEPNIWIAFVGDLNEEKILDTRFLNIGARLDVRGVRATCAELSNVGLVDEAPDESGEEGDLDSRSDEFDDWGFR